MLDVRKLFTGLLGLFVVVVFVREVGALTENHAQNVTPKLSITYFFTAEVVYQNIRLEQAQFLYTTLRPEVDNRCKHWFQQSPCWNQDDLYTHEATLSDREIRDLLTWIEQADFMRLEETYGETQGRYYAYTLTVKIGAQEKTVVYKSFPDAPPMPSAFQRVQKRLFELIKEKFQTPNDQT